jgi:hypothetical protein
VMRAGKGHIDPAHTSLGCVLPAELCEVQLPSRRELRIADYDGTLAQLWFRHAREGGQRTVELEQRRTHVLF